MPDSNKKLIIFLIIILSLVLIFNFYLLFRLDKVVEVQELNSSIIVSDNAGFDLSSEALTFGGVLKGGSATRIISIENNFRFPILVHVYGKSGMERFIVPVQEIIEVDEKNDLRISAFVPEDYDYGEYSGKVIVKILKA